MARLRGTSSKAPCWWCSRQLLGWKGWAAKVDGNVVVFHHDCLSVAVEDPDFRGRIETDERFRASTPPGEQSFDGEPLGGR